MRVALGWLLIPKYGANKKVALQLRVFPTPVAGNSFYSFNPWWMSMKYIGTYETSNDFIAVNRQILERSVQSSTCKGML